MTSKFTGSLVALITPFSSKGRVDRRALGDLVEWHIQEGTDGIVCCGTTGEASTLSDAERNKVADICIQTAGGRIPILVGTGTSDTKQTINLTKQAKKLGADGCLVVTPFYNKPTQTGCIAHFREVAGVGLPVVAYHNPGRSAFRFTLEGARALGEIPGIAALKESSGDLTFIRNFRAISPLPILAGEDDLTYSILQEGGVGAISVIGNIVPRGWKKMIQLTLSKQRTAEQWANRYAALAKGIFIETNPQCIKYLLSWMGMCEPVLRKPLLMPSVESQKILRDLLLGLALPMAAVTNRSGQV